MPAHPDAIADCVLQAFRALPLKCKPRQLADGCKEWVPLAGIVLSREVLEVQDQLHQSKKRTRGAKTADRHEDEEALKINGATQPSTLKCAALATGMKCLPRGKLPLAQGNVLHDWHAEVLAIRAFNRWLVDECANLSERHEGAASAWVRRRQQGQYSQRGYDNGAAEMTQSSEKRHWQGQPFELLEDVQIHMYCSEAPCGDASMELTMAAQEDATPWLRQEEMPGRGNFDRLGIVRRKPARPDAPETWSKSCSDKLAMKQCTSLLSGVTSLFVNPRRCYIDTLVLPESQHVATAVERAFGATGRMEQLNRDGVQEDWHKAGYHFKPFHVITTSKEFEYSRRTASTDSAMSSNLSTMVTPARQEILINGVLQGRKQFDPKGASAVCRRRMWHDTLKVIQDSAHMPIEYDFLAARTYSDVKHLPQLQKRETVKRDVRRLALAFWKKNEGDENWQLQ